MPEAHPPRLLSCTTARLALATLAVTKRSKQIPGSTAHPCKPSASTNPCLSKQSLERLSRATCIPASNKASRPQQSNRIETGPATVRLGTPDGLETPPGAANTANQPCLRDRQDDLVLVRVQSVSAAKIPTHRMQTRLNTLARFGGLRVCGVPRGPCVDANACSAAARHVFANCPSAAAS